jgi:hypothetical protein
MERIRKLDMFQNLLNLNLFLLLVNLQILFAKQTQHFKIIIVV